MRVPRSKSIKSLCFLLSAACVLQAAQNSDGTKLNKLPTGRNILWQDPGEVESRNLVWGVGGEENQPVPPFQFVEEELSGTTPKVKVKDGKGCDLGGEVRRRGEADRVCDQAGLGLRIHG